MLGVLFVALEDLDARLQEVLELSVLSGRNEGLLQCANDRLMESDLVVDIRFVELCWPFQNYRGRGSSKRSPSHE
jgi:hypothetical protein